MRSQPKVIYIVTLTFWVIYLTDTGKHSRSHADQTQGAHTRIHAHTRAYTNTITRIQIMPPYDGNYGKRHSWEPESARGSPGPFLLNETCFHTKHEGRDLLLLHASFRASRQEHACPDDFTCLHTIKTNHTEDRHHYVGMMRLRGGGVFLFFCLNK